MKRNQTDLELEFAEYIGGMEGDESVPDDFRHFINAAGMRPVGVVD